MEDELVALEALAVGGEVRRVGGSGDELECRAVHLGALVEAPRVGKVEELDVREAGFGGGGGGDEREAPDGAVGGGPCAEEDVERVGGGGGDEGDGADEEGIGGERGGADLFDVGARVVYAERLAVEGEGVLLVFH